MQSGVLLEGDEFRGKVKSSADAPYPVLTDMFLQDSALYGEII